MAAGASFPWSQSSSTFWRVVGRSGATGEPTIMHEPVKPFLCNIKSTSTASDMQSPIIAWSSRHRLRHSAYYWLSRGTSCLGGGQQQL
eukprot:scaffold110590_cov18-Prasinocladus_malaysianus.AAC.1